MTVSYLCYQSCESLIFLSFLGNLKKNFFNDKQTWSMSFRNAKEDLVPFSLCHALVRYSLVIVHSLCKRCYSVGIHQGHHGCIVSQDMTYCNSTPPCTGKVRTAAMCGSCNTAISLTSIKLELDDTHTQYAQEKPSFSL